MMLVDAALPHVVIGERNGALREQAGVAFESLGYAVTVFHDPAGLLAHLKTNSPNLVILGSTDRATSVELAVAVRQLSAGGDSRTPLLLILSDDSPELLDQVLQLGAADYVTNPVHMPTLIMRSRRIIEASFAQRLEAAEREQRIFAEALRDTASALARSLNPQGVMSMILDTVGRVVPHKLSNIMLIEGDHLRPHYLRGYTPTQEQSMKAQAFEISSPLFGSLIENGQPIVVSDVKDDPIWRDVPTLEWVRSYIATPIRAYDHVIGFINLYSDKLSAFSPQDAERMRAFADQAAIAIENSQLYDAVYRDAAEMRALHRATTFLFATNLFTSEDIHKVYEQIAHTIVREFGWLDCMLFVTNDADTALTLMARAGNFEMLSSDVVPTPSPCLISDVARAKLPKYVPDTRQIDRDYRPPDPRARSQFVIPLVSVASGDLLGVLDLQSPNFDAFSPQDQRILQAFSDRVAAVIENNLLYHEMQGLVTARTAELNRVKERVEAILNHISDAILLLGRNGHIEQANRAYHDIFHNSSEDVRDRSLLDFTIPRSRVSVSTALENVFEYAEVQRFEIECLRSDETMFDAEVVLAPLIQGSKVAHAVCSLRDISDRKKMERDLRDALASEREINSMRARFIARASHEFRTPLAKIGTAQEMLLKYYDRMTEEQRIEKHESIRSTIEMLTVLLDDLLTLSRTEALTNHDFLPIPMQLRTVVQEVLKEVQNGSGRDHQFEVNLPLNLNTVTADHRLIHQVLANLMNNAVKYSPKNSMITVDVFVEDDGFSLRVTDQGIGIPPEDRPHMFEPFFRARNVEEIEGTGLGLAIVKQSVTLHGGEISVDSSVGKGTSITVFIPQTVSARQR